MRACYSRREATPLRAVTRRFHAGSFADERGPTRDGLSPSAIAMSNQADVQSIDGLKQFRTAMALFAEESLAALGAVDMEVRRTVHWLQHDRRMYWADQIKRRREAVAVAKAEVFRRNLQKTADNSPAMSEQKEILRQAEARLHEAEMRAALVKKWEPALQHAILEYRGSIRRIKDLASGDVPRAMVLLGKLIDALEEYLRVTPPSIRNDPEKLGSLADAVLGESMAQPEAGVEQAASAPAADSSPADTPETTEAPPEPETT
jgi:hypothetical protein